MASLWGPLHQQGATNFSTWAEVGPTYRKSGKRAQPSNLRSQCDRLKTCVLLISTSVGYAGLYARGRFPHNGPVLRHFAPRLGSSLAPAGGTRHEATRIHHMCQARLHGCINIIKPSLGGASQLCQNPNADLGCHATVAQTC